VSAQSLPERGPVDDAPAATIPPLAATIPSLAIALLARHEAEEDPAKAHQLYLAACVVMEEVKSGPGLRARAIQRIQDQRTIHSREFDRLNQEFDPAASSALRQLAEMDKALTRVAGLSAAIVVLLETPYR
jgi:hypothetical protein